MPFERSGSLAMVRHGSIINWFRSVSVEREGLSTVSAGLGQGVLTMSSRWHYRIHGRDVGPVDFATLQLMAREERLFVEDEIRDETSQDWVTAGLVPGLFPTSADADDLSTMLSDSDMPAASEDRIDPEDACFCRTRTEELGPMRYDRLIGLARTGRLGRRDQVRIGAQGQWVEARSVVGLFDVPVKSASVPGGATSEAASILDSFEIVADPTPRQARAPRPAPEPLLQLVDEGFDGEDDVAPVGVADVDAQWHCRVLGQEIGPIGWTDLRELVESRQLGPNDRVRKGQSVAWVPAATIDNLFPKRKKVRLARKKKENISEEDVLDILAPDEPEEEEVSSHVAPQRNFGKPARPSNPEMPSRPASRRSDPDVALPSPAPANSPGFAAAGPAPRAPFPAPPPRPAPVKEKRKMGNPLSGLGDGMSGLSDSLADLAKPAAAIVGALLVLGAVVWGGMKLFSGSGFDGYQTTAELWREARSLRASNSDTGWQSFIDYRSGRVSGAAAQLQEDAGDPLADVLLVCLKDHFPKMMAAPIDGADEVWTKMEEDMKKAESLAQ